MLNSELRGLGLYLLRAVIYVFHSLVLMTVLAVGLFLVSSLSIAVAQYLDIIEVAFLYIVPVLGMAAYLAQHEVATMGEEVVEPEYEDASEKFAVQVFIILYYNFLFLVSVSLGLVPTILFSNLIGGSAALDFYLIAGFTYPIVDILIFKRLSLSPAAIPVAIVVSVLHYIGKATWVNVRNLNVEQVPFMDQLLRRGSPK